MMGKEPVMLDATTAYLFFCLFADLEGEAAERWEPLCRAAVREIEKELRPEVENPDMVDMERLCMAAAASAYSRYLAVNEVDEVKVGNVTVKGRADTQRHARDIRDYFMAQAADLLRCGGVLLGVGS